MISTRNSQCSLFNFSFFFFTLLKFCTVSCQGKLLWTTAIWIQSKTSFLLMIFAILLSARPLQHGSLAGHSSLCSPFNCGLQLFLFYFAEVLGINKCHLYVFPLSGCLNFFFIMKYYFLARLLFFFQQIASLDQIELIFLGLQII